MKTGIGRLRIKRGEERRARSRLLLLTGIVLILFLIIPTVARSAAEATWIIIDDPNEYFDYIPNKGAVLVYWKQEACPGCKKVEPAVIRFSVERQDVQVLVAHIDKMLRNDPEATLQLLSQLGVYGTPTFIVYKDGVEMGRHVSTFGSGDQYEPLVEFVDSSLKGESPELRPLTGSVTAVVPKESVDPETVVMYLGYAFALGLIAAISPCSLPVLAVFTASSTRNGSEDESKRFKSFLTNTLGIAAAAVGFGSLLSLLYLMGVFLPINPYVILVFAAAAFIVAWGLENLIGRDPLIQFSRRWSKLLPVLGLQCSLPFLLAMISLVAIAPHLVFGASMMFAAGYSLPYALAAVMGKGFSSFLVRIMNSKLFLRAQGLLLVAAGLYIYYLNYDALL